MIRENFFNAIRPAFGGKLSAPQVAGMNAVLDAAVSAGLSDANHVANVLAQVRRETGGYMFPIKETVMPGHKDKNPSDATVIQRLDRAYAAGKLPWVKSPYWRDGWFGRGPIQVTHRANYAKVGRAIGEDLEDNPSLALRPEIGAKVAVIGLRDGLFTGKKLADYSFPDALDAPPSENPRRIVNGKDGSDAEVARFHRQFHKALVAVGWDGGEIVSPRPDHVRKPAKIEHSAPDMSPAATQDRPKSNTVAPALIGGGIVAAVVTWWVDITATVAGWIDALTFWN